MRGSGSEVQAALGRLQEATFVTPDDRPVTSHRLIHVHGEKGAEYSLFHLAGSRDPARVRLALGEVLDRLPGRFAKVSRYDVVDLDRLEAVSGRRGRYRLHLEDLPEAVELSRDYEAPLRKRLGLRTLDHPTPAIADQRFLREHRLIDFGFEELQDLDLKDSEAVQAWKNRWDLKRLSSEEILRYFRKVGANEVDELLFVRNLLWQQYRWYSWGIHRQYEGDVRTFWYPARDTLLKHTGLFSDLTGDRYNGVVNKMVDEERLFTYKGFGFGDVRAPFRKIGQGRPEVMLIGEKIGHFPRLRRFADHRGITYGCTKGVPSHVMMEYLGDELAATGVDFGQVPLHIFAITDFDPGGKVIADTFARLLKAELGAAQIWLHPLVRRDIFDAEDYEYNCAPVVQFTKEHGKPVAWGETQQKAIDSALKWWETTLGKDPRFYREEKLGEQTIYSVMRISVDLMEWDRKILPHFEAELAPVLAGTWKPGDGGELVGGGNQPGDGGDGDDDEAGPESLMLGGQDGLALGPDAFEEDELED